MNEILKFKILIDTHCVICREQNDVRTVNRNQNHTEKRKIVITG